MGSIIVKIIVAFVIIAALFFGYNFLFVKSPASELEVVGTPTGANTELGRDFLVALINLEHINLDQGAAVLKDSAFSQLSDMSVSLPNEPAGRQNPFSPLGGDTGIAGQSQTGIQTTGQTSQKSIPSVVPELRD